MMLPCVELGKRSPALMTAHSESKGEPKVKQKSEKPAALEED
jgi:hypothetical protein